MTNKEEYRRICEDASNQIPIYSQYWWMDAVCRGKEWDVIISRKEDGTIQATLPYLVCKKFGFKFTLMPPLTQTNGIHYFYPNLKDEREKLEFEKSVGNDVVRQLEQKGLTLFLQNFAPEVTNWLPFFWNGYTQTTRYTYVIDDLNDTERVFEKFASAKQRQIRKAQKNRLQTAINALTPSEFYAYHKQLIEKQGKKEEIAENVFLTLATRALERNQGAILSITGEQGETQAALFLVWDQTTCYYLVPANDRKYSTTGAATLLVWEAIKFARERSKKFDFEGSMTESIENSYNQFGTRQTAYMQIRKGYNLAGKIWLYKHQ